MNEIETKIVQHDEQIKTLFNKVNKLENITTELNKLAISVEKIAINQSTMLEQQNYNTGNMMNQQPQAQQNVQPQAPQTSYLPLTFVNGVIGAKSFIVAPNHTIFLRDSDEGSNLLFEKSADMYGKYTIKAFRMTEIML
ncbi:MAG: hypothetical protein IKP50_03895 [Bacilli bacterium]|nr:hypothetical protein [Bacilli bacterium]